MAEDIWAKIRLASKGPDVKERARVSEGKYRADQWWKNKQTAKAKAKAERLKTIEEDKARVERLKRLGPWEPKYYGGDY
jgi:hypothetical protein